MTENHPIHDSMVEAIHEPPRRMAERLDYDPQAIADEARERQEKERRPVWQRGDVKNQP